VTCPPPNRSEMWGQGQPHWRGRRNRLQTPRKQRPFSGGKRGSSDTLLARENPCDIGVFQRLMMADRIGTILIPDRKFLFSLPIQEGTSTRLAVLILLPGRSVRQEIPRRAVRRRIRYSFAVRIREMGWCSTRTPRAPRTLRRKGRIIGTSTLALTVSFNPVPSSFPFRSRHYPVLP
jgi:hypothetical protein